MFQWLINLLGGGAGAGVGAVLNYGAKLAALAPVALWFLEHKEQEAVSFTWGQLAVVGLVVYALLEVAHRSPPTWPGAGQ